MMSAIAFQSAAAPSIVAKAPARRAHQRNRVEASRADIYDEVTRKIIAELEAGRLPWVQPWQADHAGPAMPHNAAKGRRYSGINVLLLWAAQLDAGYSSGGWMTYKQAAELGASVRKGEHGTMVVYADSFVPKACHNSATNEASGGEPQRIPFLKRFTVFNVSQIENLPEQFSAAPELKGEREQVEAAEQVIRASGVDFRIGGDKAFYVHSTDFVVVPDQRRFFAQIDYYRTACHELTHATGHHTRLDRKLMTIDGVKDRAKEELVAELGSAFVLASLGITPTVRHADYIGTWLEVLRNDKRAIFRAASAASKAADWLLSRVEG
jgi:antirestriction protein ArdC